MLLGGSLMNCVRTLVAVASSVLLLAVGFSASQGHSATSSGISRPRRVVAIDGSSTTYGLTMAVAEEYMKVRPQGRISIAVKGTGGGFTQLCAGLISMVGASRVISDQEITLCKKNGIEFLELPIAMDGLAIVVNKSNAFAKCLSVKELNTMWSANSQGSISSWNQINASFPRSKFLLFASPADTGNFDYFTKAVTGIRRNSRTDFTPNRNQNALIQGVMGNPTALAYISLGYYMQNQTKLRLVAVRNDEGKCVRPRPSDNVMRGKYNPLSRPIFLYVNKNLLDASPAVENFVEFYLLNSWKWVDAAGYVALPDAAYVKTLEKLRKRKTGSKFGAARPGDPIIDFI
jgi:phosphate transport system substrate-binding protein